MKLITLCCLLKGSSDIVFRSKIPSCSVIAEPVISYSLGFSVGNINIPALLALSTNSETIFVFGEAAPNSLWNESLVMSSSPTSTPCFSSVGLSNCCFCLFCFSFSSDALFAESLYSGKYLLASAST